MAKGYVENVGGAYRVAGSRVSLDSVVYAFLRESRRTELPSLFRR